MFLNLGMKSDPRRSRSFNAIQSNGPEAEGNHGNHVEIMESAARCLVEVGLRKFPQQKPFWNFWGNPLRIASMAHNGPQWPTMAHNGPQWPLDVPSDSTKQWPSASKI